MIQYVDKGTVIWDRINNLYIPKDNDNADYKEYLNWVDEGNTVIPQQPGPEYVLVDDDWVVDNDKNIQIQSDQIRETYNENLSNPVTCTTSSNLSIDMDCGPDDVLKLYHGIQFAELLGESTMNIVDYYNKIHYDIPIAEVREIYEQQSMEYRNRWFNKAEQIDAILP